MALVTVPGAGGTVVSNSYNEPGNFALATQISGRLSGFAANGTLTVTSVAGGSAVPPATGSFVNALEVTSGGVFSVPASYGYVLDGSSNGAVSVNGGTSFFGGGGLISYTNSGQGTSLVTVGDGTNSLNLSGAYFAASGNGFNTYKLSGIGQVSLGGGSSQINISSGADTVYAGANPGQTGIIGGSGSVYFVGGNSASQIGNVIVGGTGGDTVLGGANSLNVYASPSTGGANNPGAFLAAGSGNETLFGAQSQTNDGLWGSFGGGNDLLAAGTGNAALVAGSGVQSLIGGSGTDNFYVINSQFVSALMGTNVSPATDFIYNTRAGETVSLVGFDSLYGAAGSGAAAAFVRSIVGTGSNVVILKDGTTIGFVTGTNHVSFASS